MLCSPLMPGITDSRKSINAVAQAAAASGANFFGSGALFLKDCSKPTFFRFVREHFPEQLKSYERRYAGNAFVSAEYRTRIADVVASVCREHGLAKRYFDELDTGAPQAVQVEVQPWLPFAQAGARPSAS